MEALACLSRQQNVSKCAIEQRRGFTLVELLVVLSVITLLMAIMLPVLSRTRAACQRIVCMSNLRQWGIGTMNYAAGADAALPLEGDRHDVSLNFTQPDWWPNAIPPNLGQPPYAEISESGDVPMPPDKDIFVCARAQVPADAPYPVIGAISRPWLRYFFCYVWNQELDEGKSKEISDDVIPVRLSNIRRPVETVFMLEIRTSKDELHQDDPYHYKEISRCRANWKRFAARHRKGGRPGAHMAFCDGHVSFVSNEWATINRQGSRSESYPQGDWNKDGLIWNPFGLARSRATGR